MNLALSRRHADSPSSSRTASASTTVSRREWRWAVVASAVVIVIATLPYLVGVLSQDASQRFTGFLITIDDGQTYLAKMAQGARGDWFYTSAYAAQPGQPVFLFPFYYLLGKLTGPDWTARILGYHAARVLFGFGYLVAAYAWLAEFVPTIRGRRLGFWLLAIGGGLGWILLAGAGSGRLEDLPLDLYLPEAFSFLSLLTLPHLAAARLGLVVALLCYRRGRAWSGGLALMLVAFLVPLYPIVAGLLLVLGEMVNAVFGRERQTNDEGRKTKVERPFNLRPSSFVIRLSCFLLPSIPYVVYVMTLTALDPDVAKFSNQNILRSPMLWHYLLAYGPWLVVGWFGWRRLRRTAPTLAIWAAVWLALGIALTYIPITTQRRLIDGYWLWLAPLAARGLTVWGRGRARRLLAPALLAATLPGTLIVWGGAMAAAWGRAPIAFVSREEAAAFDWLAAHPLPDGLILASFQTGNRIPAFTPYRSVLGHGVETPDIEATEARVARFFSGELNEEAGTPWLRADGIDIVFVGPDERALGHFDPDSWSSLERIYAVDGVNLYRVRHDDSP